ncbi:hypothetical protein JOF41_004932 [Saccharothrix coeruleofusca]|uniref:hypothetical protein n=1 Tax=Saccharothrix coeruleofusca TaxID=33919 RepID=UPI001AEB7F9B|nr:hypothetical protein [Saccharothrix coeruleofusca]MBP2338754.1 hypothetical protein [Saccharothrix coeruleofusca]
MRAHLLLAVLLLAGCGVNASETGRTTTPAPLRPVDFPVDRHPRPIVLLGEPLAVERGFASNEEKLSGRYELVGPPPATPEPGALPLIGAAEAVAAMSRPSDRPPVKLVRAEFGTARFRTDRGALELPAWRFTTESGSSLARQALAPSAVWPARPSMYTATEDGLELEVTMLAAPQACPGHGPVTAEAVVAESATSVAVGLRTAGELGGCPRTADLRTQPYRVTLSAPLGARLLVDGQGGVVEVTKR